MNFALSGPNLHFYKWAKVEFLTISVAQGIVI